jgi:broad specificity phosphatase PhoE
LTARITLISHAATSAVRSAAFPLNEPLEERELARIAKIGWQAPRAQHIVSGPEERARQTAEALGLAATVANDLRDCDYGRWSGRKLDELSAADPEGLTAWLSDPSAAPHGGESIVELISRVGSWFHLQKDAGHILAITHPAVIRSAIVHALQAPAQAFWRIDISPLSLTDLRYNGSVWTVRRVASSLGMEETML